MNRVFLIAVISVLLVLLASAPLWAAVEKYDVPEGDSPYIGPEKAPVTIIEFIDYQ